MVIDKDNIPDFIWVYPRLPGETLKKIDFRFINGKQHTGGQCETCGMVAIPIKIVEKDND